MSTQSQSPPPPTASLVFWAGRCDHHARTVELELARWGHEFPDGPPDAEDSLILLRRTVGELRSDAGADALHADGLRAEALGADRFRVADLLERAAGPLEAARQFTARTLSPALLPLIAHHLRTAGAALATARTSVQAGAPAAGPFPPRPTP
ncbi:hypothetical protein [Streptomyces sp. BE303]|uniref:hypothetical protein n=1 Tax=Streptomyces sp. BE303 TaxID=3002528 RepID=UPI002E76FAFB|nr:hypothetical protein [Streptomyces sp. BE303]MED7952934.1 hypothetical protein [Streptomyces sp. BE303]